MSDTKFTKGEWIVYDSSMDWGNVNRDELVIGMDSFNHDWTDHYCAHKITIGDDEGEARANAHLIAAAPEMYEMLATIENDSGQVPAWLWDKIQSTLAKARGEKCNQNS